MSRVFFTDRDLGKQFGAILTSAGLKVERHTDHFAHDTPDKDWLAEVGRRGWIALTHDSRIRYKPTEKDAVIEHGVALLVIVGKAPFPELAKAFVTTLPRIDDFLVRHKPPFIAKVYRPSPSEIAQNNLSPGRIELWYPR